MASSTSSSPPSWVENPLERKRCDREQFASLKSNGAVKLCALCYGWKSDQLVNSHITSAMVHKALSTTLSELGSKHVLAKRENENQTITAGSDPSGKLPTVHLLCDKCDNNLGGGIENRYANKNKDSTDDWETWAFALCHTFRHLAITIAYKEEECPPQLWAMYDEMHMTLLNYMWEETKLPDKKLNLWILNMPKRVQMAKCRVKMSLKIDRTALLRQYLFGNSITAIIPPCEGTTTMIVAVTFYWVCFVFSMSTLHETGLQCLSYPPPPERKIHICRHCQVPFPSGNQLIKHCKDKHPENFQEGSKVTVRVETKLRENIGKQFQQIPSGGISNVQFDRRPVIRAEGPGFSVSMQDYAWHVLQGVTCNQEGDIFDWDTGPLKDQPGFPKETKPNVFVNRLLPAILEANFQNFVDTYEQWRDEREMKSTRALLG